MATSSSTTSSQVGGGEMNHRRAQPDPKQWAKLIKKDPLAAEIDDILRAATNARQDTAN
jgi:hypothetical protein